MIDYNKAKYGRKTVMTLCPNCKVIRKAGDFCEWCKTVVPYPEEANTCSWDDTKPGYDEDD